MSHSGFDDYAAQGICSNCYTRLDYKEGCPDCDDTCQTCGEYMWQFDEPTWKIVDEEPMCQECWLENPNPFDFPNDAEIDIWGVKKG